MPPGSSITCRRPCLWRPANGTAAAAGASVLLSPACLRRLLPAAAIELRPLLTLRWRLRVAAALRDECSLSLSQSLLLLSRELLLHQLSEVSGPSMLLLVRLSEEFELTMAPFICFSLLGCSVLSVRAAPTVAAAAAAPSA